jgi:hypothetical protein
MLLMIALGLFTTLFGVALGSAVLELAVRALAHSLAERPLDRPLKAGSRFTMAGRGVMLKV